MKRKSKIIISFVMFIMIIAVGFFENNINLKNAKLPAHHQGDMMAGEAHAADTIKYDKDKNSNEKTGQEIPNTEAAAYSSDRTAQINEIMKNMTIEEKVGQMFFIKNDGRFNESILEEYPAGGIILFAKDFQGETPESVKAENDAFQEKSSYPLLIGTDEEGGTVVRISSFGRLALHQFMSPRQIYANGGFDAIKQDTIEKSRLLLSYGINVNFAPVCDVTTEAGQYMYPRSFGKDATETAEYIDLVVGTMNDENMGSVLKHFPGYGGNGDTHTGVVRDSRPYSDFEESDFLPFMSGIEAGAECILVSHNIVECMDDTKPASISGPVHEILRNELGFSGVIITDDLMMSGVSEASGDRDVAVQAVLAGNDMILSTYFQSQYKAVLAAVNDGTITEDRIDASVRRIINWKIELGLFD